MAEHQCPKCGKKCHSQQGLEHHLLYCQPVQPSPETVVSPAPSKPENPYNHEQHTIYDCAEITESLCPTCLEKTAWQEDFEAGKPRVSVEQIATAIVDNLNCHTDCKVEYQDCSKDCPAMAKVTTAIKALFEEAV